MDWAGGQSALVLSAASIATVNTQNKHRLMEISIFGRQDYGVGGLNLGPDVAVCDSSEVRSVK